MDADGKDDVPILTATDWASDRHHEHNLNRRFTHRTRSVSISIPVSSIELNSGATNRVDSTSPLRSERKTHDVRRQEREPVAREHTTSHNHQNEYLLRSGRLGMCNDRYCTTCPACCQYKTQLISRVSHRFDHHNDGVQHGDIKAWAREKLSLLQHFAFGVMNPHAKVVQQWNQFIMMSCSFALFIDPLFCYVLSVNKDFKCIAINWPMTKAIVVLRSMTDLIYLMHILVRMRLAFLSHESRVVGSPKWVDHPRKIALHYLSRTFFYDLFITLPVPQIIVLLILPNVVASLGSNYAKNLLQVAVLVQYILKWSATANLIFSRRRRSNDNQSRSLPIFMLNLLSLITSGHVIGSCWYLLGVQRVNQCLREACHNSTVVHCMKFIYCGQGNDSWDFQGDQEWNNRKQNNNMSACFTEDGFPYGIYAKAVNLTTKDSIITRYVYSLFWGFQQVSTLASNQTPSYSFWEVLFCICITGIGLIQFALLIGNLQTFVQGLGRRHRERTEKQHEVELWMRRRHLPINLQRKVRASEHYNWDVTQGFNEEMLMENFPEDLQRDIRRHLFKFVKKVQIFALMDEPIIDTIYERLRKKTYIKEGIILYRGGVVTKMVFIARGKMESMGEDGNKVSLSEGDVCGEELLRWYPEHSSGNGDTRNLRKQGLTLLSNRTVKCLTNVDAYVIWAEELEEVTNLFPGFMRNHRFQFSIRNDCPYWQGVAATTIQVAWRYRKKRLSRVETSHGHATRLQV